MYGETEDRLNSTLIYPDYQCKNVVLPFLKEDAHHYLKFSL